MRYTVECMHRYVQTLEVKASSIEEAIEIVREGGGDEIRDFEDVEMLPADTWKVYDENGNLIY